MSRGFDRMATASEPRTLAGGGKPSFFILFIGLTGLFTTLYLDVHSLHLPEVPVSQMIVFPISLLLIATFVQEGAPDGLAPPEIARFAILWERLRWSALVLLGLAPFAVWQFRLYENRYMLACGLLALVALVLFLVQLLRVEELLFTVRSNVAMAAACRWTGVVLPPLTATVGVTVYAYAFRYGGRWLSTPVESPYSVWLKLPGWIQWMPVVPFSMVCMLTLGLIVSNPESRDGATDVV